jgi:hypothetical protein
MPFEATFVWRPRAYLTSPDTEPMRYGFELIGVRADGGIEALEPFEKALSQSIQQRRYESRIVYAWRLVQGVTWPLFLLRRELVDDVEVLPDECILKHSWEFVGESRFPVRAIRELFRAAHER